MSAERLETIGRHIRLSTQYVCEIFSFNFIENCFFFLKKSEQQQPEYRYTLRNGSLTNEQREFYEKNGFIVIRNLVKPKTLDHFR